MKADWCRWLDLAGRWGRLLENVLLSLLLSALILLASSQIVLRNVFSTGLTWGDGLIRLMVLWLALLGAIAASRDGKQIAIDVVTRVLPETARRVTEAVAHAFTALVTGLLAWHSARFVLDSLEFGDTMLNDWPAWVLQLILPVGFAVICYRYLVRCVAQLTGLR